MLGTVWEKVYVHVNRLSQNGVKKFRYSKMKKYVGILYRKYEFFLSLKLWQLCKRKSHACDEMKNETKIQKQNVSWIFTFFSISMSWMKYNLCAYMYFLDERRIWIRIQVNYTELWNFRINCKFCLNYSVSVQFDQRLFHFCKSCFKSGLKKIWPWNFFVLLMNTTFGRQRAPFSTVPFLK